MWYAIPPSWSSVDDDSEGDEIEHRLTSAFTLNADDRIESNNDSDGALIKESTLKRKKSRKVIYLLWSNFDSFTN